MYPRHIQLLHKPHFHFCNLCPCCACNCRVCESVRIPPALISALHRRGRSQRPFFCPPCPLVDIGCALSSDSQGKNNTVCWRNDHCVLLTLVSFYKFYALCFIIFVHVDVYKPRAGMYYNGPHYWTGFSHHTNRIQQKKVQKVV